MLHNLAVVTNKAGDNASARALSKQCLAARQGLGDRQYIAQSLEFFACLNEAEGKWQHAVRLLGAAELLRAGIGSPLAPCGRDEHQQRLTDIRGVIGEEAFSAAWTEGRAMTMEQAIESVLDDGACP